LKRAATGTALWGARLSESAAEVNAERSAGIVGRWGRCLGDTRHMRWRQNGVKANRADGIAG
jgi:hypothetical protein